MKIQISRMQLVFLMIWMVAATGMLALPTNIGRFTIHDGWLVSFFFLAGTLFAAALSALFVRMFPGQSLTDALRSAFGPWLGFLLGLWMVIWYYIILSTILRELVLFIGTPVLTKTPLHIIGAVIMIPVAYGVSMGIEVLGRVAELVTPVFLFILAATILLSLMQADFSQLKPVLAEGWSPVWKASVTTVTVFSMELIISLQWVPYLRDRQTLGRDLLISGGIISAISLLIMIAIISVEGPAYAYLSYPILELVRSVRIGKFIERLDTLYVMAVIVTMFLKISAVHYAFCTCVQQVFRLASHRTIVLSASAAVWAGSVYLFQSSVQVSEFIQFVGPGYFIFTIVLIPLLAIVVYGIRKRGNSRPKETAS
jgi:spore germination protein KB